MCDTSFVNFEIERIYAGWFDVSFQQDNKKLTISASDTWGNDSPGKFLEALYEFYVKKASHRFVIWDEEPGVYFICLDKIENKTRMIVAYSEQDDDELGEVFQNVVGDLSYEKIKDYFDDLQDLLIVENLNINHFVRVVYERFCGCNIEEYQNHWMDYPHEQLEKLKIALG